MTEQSNQPCDFLPSFLPDWVTDWLSDCMTCGQTVWLALMTVSQDYSHGRPLNNAPKIYLTFVTAKMGTKADTHSTNTNINTDKG